MLYDVPQTDSAGEPAMAALIARFRLRAPKPEALAAGAPAGVSDALIALHLAEWVGRICSALRDRVQPGARVVKWGPELDGGCCTLAAWGVYMSRGVNRQAGADNSIDSIAERQEKFLAQLMSADRQHQPEYVDSGSNKPADAPLVSTQPTASSWTRDNRWRRC